jgi:hypothetical protein
MQRNRRFERLNILSVSSGSLDLRKDFFYGTRNNSCMKLVKSILFAAVLGIICVGCEKSAPKSTEAAPPVIPRVETRETVARLHWLGRKKIAATTNSTAFMKIWDAPESARVQAQTLDKLSTAPWRLLPAATTNTAAAPLLRTLLEDCVDEESYLEIRGATNQPGELAFAIHLSAERASVWETNLATVLESLTAIHPTSNSEAAWSLKKHDFPNLVEFARVADWTVIGIGENTNALFSDFLARTGRSRSPLAAGAPDFWVDADVDLRGISDAFKLDWKLPDHFPAIMLNVVGKNPVVATRGTLIFPTELKLNLKPWQIPLGLIRPPFSSFMAIRGIDGWLGSLKAWKDLQVGAPPDQAFCWALHGAAQMTFLAVPLPDATNRVAQISESVMNKYGASFATNDSFGFEKSPDGVGLTWTGVPFLSPYLQAAKTDEGEFAFVGLFPNRPVSPYPFPEPLLNEINTHSNLVYYDWELTGPRVDSLLYVLQFFRFASQKSQLPNEAASTAWLNNTATNFGNSVTELVQTGPRQLSFVRSSSSGFSALELHLLADWLESPQFPRGLNTFLGEPTPGHGRLPLKRQNQ